ncbi:PREDICTED: solute carrier family 23 member 2-like [Priapulus caudatus]|uniref:Solute carrier family 23 member 2-like n=1 Tax=Priapulus caudatus TaxID=37621 RepID=A0ABM1FB75_PRICU|nr:PREDICTED: solute carrier family 23 member 2-like [Priapulus caudatus]
MFLSMGFFIGGVVGFILDNTAPGTPEERGIIKFNARISSEHGGATYTGGSMLSYDLPYVTDFLGRFALSKYIPILPQFRREQYLPLAQNRDDGGVNVTETVVTGWTSSNGDAAAHDSHAEGESRV